MEEVCPGWAVSQYMETHREQPRQCWQCCCGPAGWVGAPGGRQEAGATADTTGLRILSHLLTCDPSQLCFRLFTF